MKTYCSINRQQGLTLIEVLVVIMVVFIFVCMLIPASTGDKAHALRITCINNLKQNGLAYRIWEGDHNDKYPMHISETNGGTMEFISGPNAFRHLQVMSNELSTPQLLICPAESDKARFCATNFSYFNNSNLSYFVGLDADESDPQRMLCGDRNITNGTPLKDGVLELTTDHSAGWTAEIHNKVGNVVLDDGSVQELSAMGLRNAVTNVPAFTNRLLMPVLGP